jgi:preprotein translocase subunit SecA
LRPGPSGRVIRPAWTGRRPQSRTRSRTRGGREREGLRAALTPCDADAGDSGDPGDAGTAGDPGDPRTAGDPGDPRTAGDPGSPGRPRAVSVFRERVRRFLQRPGTADLTGYQRLLPAIAAREETLRDTPDARLPDAASGARDDDAAFCAVGREAARRALGERPYDVQLLGTLVMLSGHVAEMATGEGKTLSGALAAAGYALRGHSVHVMSVNDYLARRDAEWMRPVYDLLGVTVGWVGQASTRADRRRAYAAQVTYAPVSEIGFDVLRDRLAATAADLIVPDPDVVLIDEADSVLIDEARVPLVLAGATDEGAADLGMAEIVRRLRPRAHYEIDDDARNVQLTDAGARAAERALGGIDLYAPRHLDALTRLNVALHAQALLRRDVDYIVRDGRVHLINASRGRVARLQRWPDGLQAAVEAKESLAVSESGEILDSITVESLIRRYPRACGMTGTAVAVGEQLREFYGLEVAVIPPNRPCVREDQPDRLYATLEQKENAIVGEVTAAHATGRPVLVGTLDIAESERLAQRLSAAGLPCVVLNAKNDAEEAAIVAEAGAGGAITVSTQMAGRGTDIRLGGSTGDSASDSASDSAGDSTGDSASDSAGDSTGDSTGDSAGDSSGDSASDSTGDRTGDRDQIARLGGLYVIGTGRHASSRLDVQLRGRSGRQGDPGGSVFFVSMEDELIVSYAPDAEEPREVAADGRVGDARARWTVGHAQRAAESDNLEIHRNTWRYNKLIEDQRRIVFDHRRRLLGSDAALQALAGRCPERYRELAATADPGVLAQAARQIVLYHLDRGWADHLAVLAGIREGIHLRALGHSANPFVMALDPLSEFHAEAVRLFARLLEQVEQRSAETFQTAEITSEGVDLDAAGLKRPTATWTYVVQDNPFGTDLDRALRGLRRLTHPRSR